MVEDLFNNDESENYSLGRRVFNILRQQILDCKYMPGDNLIETKIADEFDVSRTPIREAIRQLELAGLVESIPNKGVVVRGISEQDMNDIYSIRQILEGLATRWAIENINCEELKELKDIFELMEFYTNKGAIEQVSDLNTRFHKVIFKAARSSILQGILTDFQYYVQWARFQSLKSPGRLDKALEEHRKILKAFIGKDYENAEKIVIEHIINSSN